MTTKNKFDSGIVNEGAEDLDPIQLEVADEWETLERGRWPGPSSRRKSPVVRKLGTSFLVLAGMGALIILGRIYLKVPEEPPAARFPIHSPPTSALVSQPKISPGVEEGISKKEAAPHPRGTALDGKSKPSAAAKFEDSLSSPSSQGIQREGSDSPAAEAKSQPGSVSGTGKPEAETGLKKTVAVKGGDSIYMIAAKKYGVANTSVIDRILDENPQISSPGKLLANQQIRLPEITEESLLMRSTDGTYRIRLGTFLKPEYSMFLKGEPALRGREVEVTPRKLSSAETWYRATAGKFNTREEGLKAIHELKEKGLSPYFVGFRKSR